MSLERAIHERWSSDASLAELLPAERLFTGAALGGPQRPYAVLTRHADRPVSRTSSGTRIDEIITRFSVWTIDLDEGHRIIDAAERLFDGQSFSLSAGAVRQLRMTNRTETIQDDASWNLTADLVALVERGP